MPANVRKLYDARLGELNDGKISRTEYAMLDLAKDHVNPEYTPGEDPQVTENGADVSLVRAPRLEPVPTSPTPVAPDPWFAVASAPVYICPLS